VTTDSTCSIVVSPQTPSGDTPAASMANMRLAADQTEYVCGEPEPYSERRGEHVSAKG
jgi:hypothetical protein